MKLDPRELHLLHQSVQTRLSFFDQLISQENNRPQGHRGLLPGFIAQMTELQDLSNRLAQELSETH